MGVNLVNHLEKKSSNGFTIVELLIVIVVIAILASIAIVAYTGVQNRASESAVQSDISQFYRHAMAQEEIGEPSIGERNEWYYWVDAYNLIDEDDVTDDCYVDDREYNGTSIRSCKLAQSGIEKVEAYIGGSPNAASYYNNPNQIYSLLLTDGWGADGQRMEIVARSKSGKTFIRENNVTQAFNEDHEWMLDYITDYEDMIVHYDTCASEGECEGYEWTSEDDEWWNGEDGRSYYEQEIARLREEIELSGDYDFLFKLWENDTIFYSATDDSWYVGGEGS